LLEQAANPIAIVKAANNKMNFFMLFPPLFLKNEPRLFYNKS